MPWKDGYTISDERGVPDGDPRWPAGCRSALRLTVVLGAADEPSGVTAGTLSSASGHFGVHRGLDLILSALDRLAVRATFAVPALVAAARPEAVARIVHAGHETAPLGLAHEDVSKLDCDTEAARIREAVALMTDVTGRRPAGWFALPRSGDRYAAGSVSPSTVRLLMQEGFNYLGNSTADDRPHYWFVSSEHRNALLALPYYYHFDDLYFSMFPARGSGLENTDVLDRNWRAEFRAQYRRQGLTSLVVHTHAAGWPSRLERLEAFLRDATRLPEVWTPTSAELAEHWVRAHPVTETDVRPSVWQIHADSLN